VLGRAFKGSRDKVVIATKFGNTFNRPSLTLTGTNLSPKYIKKACEDSLQRLQTDWIDLYQVHVEEMTEQQIPLITDVLDELCCEGKIRYYGWSTNNTSGNQLFSLSDNACAFQFDMNVLQPNAPMLSSCQENDCTAIIRQPLAMGLLSGKYATHTALSTTDIRKNPPPC